MPYRTRASLKKEIVKLRQELEKNEGQRRAAELELNLFKQHLSRASELVQAGNHEIIPATNAYRIGWTAALRYVNTATRGSIDLIRRTESGGTPSHTPAGPRQTGGGMTRRGGSAPDASIIITAE